MATLMKNSRERLRRRYRPSEILLLFIGEARPASGRFFYRQDSGLYRAIRDAFCSLDPSVTDDRFLDIFQETGCYLRISRFQPAAIATLLRSIQNNVRRAADRAG